MSEKILVNAIRTPDGTVLDSRHRHDYKAYKDQVTEEIYIVDGGMEYLRRTVNKIPATELSVYEDDSHEDIREVFTWGTYGKDGQQPKAFIKLKDMSDDHIKAIIKIQMHSPNYLMKVFTDEQDYRKESKDE